MYRFLIYLQIPPITSEDQRNNQYNNIQKMLQLTMTTLGLYKSTYEKEYDNETNAKVLEPASQPRTLEEFAHEGI